MDVPIAERFRDAMRRTASGVAPANRGLAP